jgi:hypothetical protein
MSPSFPTPTSIPPSLSISPAPAPRRSRHLAGLTPSADGGVIQPLTTISPTHEYGGSRRLSSSLQGAAHLQGKVWGFFDDGDMFALYYRKDIFEDPS